MSRTTETPSLWTNIRELPGNVWHSVFRNPLPADDLERSSTSFTNFFLHIHPVKVNRHTLKPLYTMGLGLISFFMFLILTVTGVLLMFYYVPSTNQAYDRMLDLRGTVAFGIFLRNMHRWSAHGMVGVVFLHMCRVFFTGSYKKAARVQLGARRVFLFLVTLFMSFTGVPAALGPVGLLGHHGRHVDRGLRAGGRTAGEISAAGRRPRWARKRCCASTCCT